MQQSISFFRRIDVSNPEHEFLSDILSHAPHVKNLGYVACHATSKVLDVGAADCSCYDVKQFKSGRQSHWRKMYVEHHISSSSG
jgi:hypothetical protein